jgi:hypothetical protein
MEKVNTVKYSASHIEDNNICSNYLNGMCTEEEDKQCDMCASKFTNIINIKNKYEWLCDKIDEKEKLK